MDTKGQVTAKRGAYLFANMLAKHGIVASPTSRSAAGADILATDGRHKKPWSIEVKTNNSCANFWLLGKKPKEYVSDTHFYVFVSIRSGKRIGESIDYYVVPSKVVARRMRPADPSWQTSSIHGDKIEEFHDNWGTFGGS